MHSQFKIAILLCAVVWCGASPTPIAAPTKSPTAVATPISTPISTPAPCATRVNLTFPQATVGQAPAPFTAESCSLEQGALSSVCVAGSTITPSQAGCVAYLKNLRDSKVPACKDSMTSIDAIIEFPVADQQLNFCTCMQNAIEQLEVLSEQLNKSDCKLGDA